MQSEALLYLSEGYIFGNNGKGYERINIACPTQVLQDGLVRLLQAIKQYKIKKQIVVIDGTRK